MLKTAPVRVRSGVYVSCKETWLDPDVFYMAEICSTDDSYPKYFIKLSHKYIAGCCIEVGSFLSAPAAEEWLSKFFFGER